MTTTDALRVVLVEDDASNAAVLSVLLRRCGVDFTILDNGGSLVDAVRDKNPDLVLLDLQLPHEDGFALKDRLNTEPDLAGIPVVGLSVMDSCQAIPLCKAHGFSGYLLKPINVRDFVDNLERIKNGERIWEHDRPRFSV